VDKKTGRFRSEALWLPARMLDEFRELHRQFDTLPELFGSPAGSGRGRTTQAFHPVQEGFKTLGEEFLPESRIAARPRQVGIRNR
jgi:hypothetical protein